MLRGDFRREYVRRVLDEQLDDLMPHLPALLIDGPKAVGKTRTAEQRAKTVWQLHQPAVASVVAADPVAALNATPPVLLDEYQKLEPLWDKVKDFVDRDLAPGRFLLTGSGPPPGAHSGAGRIASLRMRPLTIAERGVAVPSVSIRDLFAGGTKIKGNCPLRLKDYTDLILGAGFPGMQHLDGTALNAQLDGYLDRLVDRDMPEAGLRVRRPATLKAWLRAYGAAVSTTASWDKIRDAASPGHGGKPAKTTTLPYIDTLTELRILPRTVPTWGSCSSPWPR